MSLSVKITNLIFNQLFLSVLAFFSTILVARSFGPEDMGKLGFSFAIIGIFSLVNQLGFKHAHVKRISEGFPKEESIGTFLTIKLVLNLVFIFTTIMFVTKYIDLDDITLELVIILVFSRAIFQMSNFFINTFEAYTETAKQSLSLSSGELFRIILTFLVVYIGFGLEYIALTYVLGSIVTFFVSFSLFKNYKIGKPSLKIFKSYSIYALAVFIPAIFGQISTHLDKILLEYFQTTYEVGQYYAIQKLIVPLLFISSSFQTLIMPKISEYNFKGTFNKSTSLVHTSEKYLSIIFIPSVIVALFCSEIIISLVLGNEYVKKHDILLYLLIMVYLLSITRPYFSFLMGIDKPKIVAYIGISSAFINIFLNLIFIPEEFLGYSGLNLGASGAAISTVVSIFFSFILARFFSYRYGLAYNFKILLHLTFLIAILPFLYFTHTDFYIFNVIQATIILFLFFFVMYFFSEITKKDFLKIKKSLSFRIQLGYIRNEVKK